MWISPGHFFADAHDREEALENLTIDANIRLLPSAIPSTGKTLPIMLSLSGSPNARG
jgi:hypothetical protein